MIVDGFLGCVGNPLTSTWLPSASVLRPSCFTMICSRGAVYQRTCCRHLTRLVAGTGPSSVTPDQQPTERLVIAFESVSAACVPALPPDMSPPSMNMPSFRRISASSADAFESDAVPADEAPEVDEGTETVLCSPNERKRATAAVL